MILLVFRSHIYTVDFLMNEGDNFKLNRQYHLNPITFLMSGIIFTGIFVCTLVLNQNHTAMATTRA